MRGIHRMGNQGEGETMHWLKVTDRRYGLDFLQCYCDTDDELARLAWGFLKAGMSVEVIA